MEQIKRLYRNRYDTVIAGVAAGLAKYFNLDPLLVRVLFVVFALFGAGGVILYIILWIAIPLDPDYSFNKFNHSKNSETMENENQEKRSGDYKPYPEWEKRKTDGNLIAGIILITLGALFIIDRFIPRIDFGDLWPVLLIVAGILIMRNSLSKPKSN
nr:PspC domain-containing protein [Bacteroidota bacterium]